jgi:hypothetical protein
MKRFKFDYSNYQIININIDLNYIMNEIRVLKVYCNSEIAK